MAIPITLTKGYLHCWRGGVTDSSTVQKARNPSIVYSRNEWHVGLEECTSKEQTVQWGGPPPHGWHSYFAEDGLSRTHLIRSAVPAIRARKQKASISRIKADLRDFEENSHVIHTVSRPVWTGDYRDNMVDYL